MEFPRGIKKRVYTGSGLPPRPTLKPVPINSPKNAPPVYLFTGLDQPIDREWKRLMKAVFDEDDRLVLAIRDSFMTFKDRSVLIEVGQRLTSKNFQIMDDPESGLVLVVDETDLWSGRDVNEIYELIENIFRDFYKAVRNKDKRAPTVINVEQVYNAGTKEIVKGVIKPPWRLAPDVIATKAESEDLGELYFS